MPINAVIIPHIPTSVMRARVSRRRLAHRSITKQCFFRPVCQCSDNPVDVLFGQRTATSGLWKPQAWEVQRRRIWQRQVQFGYSCTPCNCISSTILLAAVPPLPYPRRTKNAILISMDKKPARNLTGFLATTAGTVVNNNNSGKLPGLSRKLLQKALSEHKKNALTKVKSSGNTREHSMVLRDEWEDEIATLRLQFEQKDIEEENEGKNNLKPQRGGANKEQIQAGDGRN
uniref:Uncharacterized protein n=1 Tax=Oryza sativa subsp. japonica TaxID=39947 RepID=Q8H5I7_ORYSJ|nr:hypothetical protein [Oryza sativa Japonica Group]